jgi:hypothetical protein
MELELGQPSPVHPSREERQDRGRGRRELGGKSMGSALQIGIARLGVVMQQQVRQLMGRVEPGAISRLLVSHENDVRPVADPAREGIQLVRGRREPGDDHAATLQEADDVKERAVAEIPRRADCSRRLIRARCRIERREVGGGQSQLPLEGVYELGESLDLGARARSRFEVDRRLRK